MPHCRRAHCCAAAPAPPLATNPLLTAGAFPLWDQIKPANIKPAVQQVLAEEGAAFTLLEQDLVRAGRNVTFDRIFKPYTQMELRIDAVTGQIDHLSVSQQQLVVTAIRACTRTWLNHPRAAAAG